MMKFIVVLVITIAWGWLIKHNGGSNFAVFAGSLGVFVFSSYVTLGNWRR